MKKAFALSVLLLAVVVLGAMLKIEIAPYALIVGITVFVILVALRKIDLKTYPIYLFGISLGLLWQTSLLGSWLVGADLHMEYHVSSIAINYGLNAASAYQYGASGVVTLLAPALSKMFHIELVWVYKLIFPMMLATVPVIMYFVFKSLMGAKKAIWAALFFIFVPVMSLEIIGIAKAMVAEVFFALTILVMVSNMKQAHKVILLPILILLAMAGHYSVGLVLWGFVCICLVVSTITKLLRVKWFDSRVSLLTLVIVFILTTSMGYAYLSNVGGGEIMDSVHKAVASSVATFTTKHPKTPIATVGIEVPIVYISNQSPLVRAGIGSDFPEASAWGKTFRIVQYITQFLIVIGLIQLLRTRKHYKFTLEYVGMMIGGFIMIAACIYIPYFSNILNMTRFYHLGLFFLAPLFVLGCDLIIKKSWFVPSILMVYFAFTSGLLYEVTSNTVVEHIDIPYSYALSYERTGVVGVNNDDDLVAAKWLAENSNPDYPIFNDMNTLRLMQGFLDSEPRLFWIGNGYFRPYTIYDNNNVSKYYIFLDTWNAEHGKMVFNFDTSYPAGLRKTNVVPAWIKDLPVAFSSGEAVVYIGGNNESR